MNGKITYRQQYTRCGKQRCHKCKEGAGHGPYWYAYWSENGRTVSKYIGIHPPAELESREQQHSRPDETGEKAGLFSSVQTLPSLEAGDGTPDGESKKSLDKAASNLSGPQTLLRIYLLGQFRVDRKEENVWQTVANRTWQRRRARALLGCLLSQAGRRMGREQVMEALWPDLDIETAANRLNGAVHELRQILEPEIARPAASKLLRLERDILMLADTSQIWVDAEVFEGLLNRANTTRDAEQVEQILEQAAGLYEGDYLLEELYSEWAATRREALRRGWMGLLLELAELRAARGALTSAIEPLDRLLTTDPTHETAVRRLMVLLTQLDRRGEAIRAYQRLAAILQRDYENDPLPETVELYQALRQGSIQTARPLTGPLPALALANKLADAETSQRSQPHPLLHRPQQDRNNLAEQDTPASPVGQHIPRSVLPPGRHNQSPLIGRERELETMRQVMLTIDQISPQIVQRDNKKGVQREQRSLQAHAVILMGETGIGKTRLAEELSHEAHARGWMVAWTRAYEQEGTIPYRPWTDILRTLLQDISLNQVISIIERGTLATREVSGALNPTVTAQTKLSRLCSLLPELAADQALSLQQNYPQITVPPEQERLHLWEAMLTLLSALSQSAPLLLVLDDLHWTDDSSLELLAYLARHQQNERIMLIGTCRDIELAPSASLRALLNDLRREQVLVTLPLQLLTTAQVGQLIAHLPRNLVRSIQSQAGGNPLFAEELARLSETQPDASEKEPDTRNGHYPGSLSEISAGIKDSNRSVPLPETIAAVLERRLSKLSSECQTLLGKAAVLGGSFEFGLLMRMTAEAGANEDTTLDLLEEALRSGLLTEESSGTRIIYHFWHPLIVSHLYEHLSAARRAQLHRRTAQALIELHTNNEAEVAAAIAYHLGKHGNEKQQFAYYAEIAGKQAHTIFAYPEALHYYRLALETLEELHPLPTQDEQASMHIATLLECMADCNQMRGNYQESREQYTRVFDLHTAQHVDVSNFATPAEFEAWREEEAQIQGILLRSIGRGYGYTGDYQMAHECARRGKEVLREAGITTGPAWGCLQQMDGTIYWLEGNFDEARRHTLDALNFHRTVRRNSPASRPRAGEHNRKERVPARLMIRSRRALFGDPLELGRAHETLGVIAASSAQYNEALQHLSTALAIFEEHDMVGAMSQTCGNLGAVHAMKAENEIAMTYFKRALDLTERTGDIPSKTFVTGNLGDVAARNGKLQEAEEWLQNSLVLAERISDREHISWCLATLGIVQQDLGNSREALESIRRALVIGRQVKSTVRVGFALVAMADWRTIQVLRNSQRDAERLRSPAARRSLRSAKAAVERALALEGTDAETQCTGQIALAHISYLLGDLEQAYQQASQALEATRQGEIVQLNGRSHRILGEIQATMNLEQEAEASFSQALQVFQKYGLLLDYARALQRYGEWQIRRSVQTTNKGYQTTLHQQGLDYLHEARDIFETAKASIDLQWVERLLAHPVRP
jgi:DNA-binding SARP family transcriptional activator